MESRIAAYLQLPKPDCPRRRSGLLVTAGRSISKCWRRVAFKSFIYILVPINHLLLPALWSQGMALAKDKRPSFSTANLRTGNSGSVSSPMLSSTCPCHWFSLHLSRSCAVQRQTVKEWGGSVCSVSHSMVSLATINADNETVWEHPVLTEWDIFSFRVVLINKLPSVIFRSNCELSWWAWTSLYLSWAPLVSLAGVAQLTCSLRTPDGLCPFSPLPILCFGFSWWRVETWQLFKLYDA